MTIAPRSIWGSLSLAFAVLCPPGALAQDYDVVDLGPLGHHHQTWGVNQIGQVVGYTYELPAGDTEGFVHDGTEFIFIGQPPQAVRSDLLDINNLGQAAGKAGTPYEGGQAILWTPGGGNGRLHTLGTLGGNTSAASSLNDLGQVVGWSKLAGDTTSRPFIWEDDVMTALPLLGGTQGAAEYINNNGQIIGSSTTDTDGLQQFAVIWEGGVITRLPPTYPGRSNIARHIHDNGDIAGSIREPAHEFSSRAAIWRDGEVHLRLGTLADGTPVEPFAASWASGVNADGVVVGMSVNPQSALVPFVYRNNEMVQLDDLMPDPWVAVFIGSGSINDAGQIAVSGLIAGDTSGNVHALLLTPTEPTAVSGNAAPSGYALSARANRITFSIPHQESVSLRIFDIGGRRLATLVEAQRPSGVHVTTWEGQTIHGREAPSGVYFARLETPTQVLTCRVLRVK